MYSSAEFRNNTAITINMVNASDRRARNLERNRIAATKCRRRKNWQDSLERKKNELKSRYKALYHETEKLAEEVA
ncbi:Cyclic AMP-dependent transcription factor ATF-7 [Beauveria bassiana]|uniref:Cyclic AMP-dependent transcription factor ATF-7 n=1 Tax=Beauveria bassiana TaxID=176275 RepID=A0A2N6N8B2_BEABA|nr:Cyclic AMP-dependent transcription factor ATF-7 [Beauveria bassiana]